MGNRVRKIGVMGTERAALGPSPFPLTARLASLAEFWSLQKEWWACASVVYLGKLAFSIHEVILGKKYGGVLCTCRKRLSVSQSNSMPENRENLHENKPRGTEVFQFTMRCFIGWEDIPLLSDHAKAFNSTLTISDIFSIEQRKSCSELRNRRCDKQIAFCLGEIFWSLQL